MIDSSGFNDDWKIIFIQRRSVGGVLTKTTGVVGKSTSTIKNNTREGKSDKGQEAAA